MDSVNYLGQDQFPLAIETTDFTQEMIFLAAKLAYIAGDGNYILYGCIEEGMNISDGYVLINGEILPFVGGVKQTTVYVNEVRRDVNASGYLFPQAYKTRKVEFGLGSEQQTWASFKPVLTNAAIVEELKTINTTISNLTGIPSGVICMWSGDPGGIPQGWALCDGLQGRPNLMGRFIVGYNQTDNDYNAIGKTGGEKTHTLSIDEMPSHDHEENLWKEGRGTWRGGGDNSSPESVSWHNDTQKFGKTEKTGGGKAHENRPPYYVLAYIIKL